MHTVKQCRSLCQIASAEVRYILIHKFSGKWTLSDRSRIDYLFVIIIN